MSRKPNRPRVPWDITIFALVLIALVFVAYVMAWEYN